MTIIFALLVLGVAFGLRYFPHFLATNGIGVDHWYWREYIETYRRERQFPPVMPQYLLESHQWYPPFFPLMMAHLPKVIFDKFSHIFAILIDLLRLSWLMAIVFRLTDDPIAMAVAGSAYAFTPLLVSYNVQLNPRGLAALMLDFIVVAVILAFYHNGPLWLWIAPIPFLGLVLLTHKMTTQLFWFLCLTCGLLWDWRLLVLIPVSILVALLISWGFYWKVVQHHWDIVTFWNRNWRWLGANSIKESPIYGEADYETPGKLHRGGLRGAAKNFYSLLGYNPYAWLMVTTLPLYPIFPIPNMGFLHLAIMWLGLILIFSLLTFFVPIMRCLGAGHLYLYNAAFPGAILWGFLYTYWNESYVLTFLIFGGVVSSLGIGRYYVHVRKSGSGKIDDDLEAALDYLLESPRGTVMCGKTEYDVVAYKTRQPVLYGGHGFGFKMLEPTYPRLLVTVDTLMLEYGLQYILFEEGYLTSKFIAELPPHDILSFGRYKIIYMTRCCNI